MGCPRSRQWYRPEPRAAQAPPLRKESPRKGIHHAEDNRRCRGQAEGEVLGGCLRRVLEAAAPYAKVTVAEIPDVDPARAGGVEAAREREGQAFWRRCRKARTSSSWPSRKAALERRLLPSPGRSGSARRKRARVRHRRFRRRERCCARPGRRDVLLRPHHPAPQLGPRRAARAALPRLQNLPRRALSQVGSLLGVQSKVGKRSAQCWAEARLPSSYTGLIRQEGRNHEG